MIKPLKKMYIKNSELPQNLAKSTKKEEKKAE